MSHVHLTLRSTNKKTGPIPVSTTSADTCPPTCSLRDQGCYARGGPLQIHWRMVTEGVRGTDWNEFCDAIAALPEGQLWRHNQAGDLPGTGGVIDREKLEELVEANRGRRGFTYTHYPPTTENLEAIEYANENGFCINLSADNLVHADRLCSLTRSPVVSLLPRNWPTRSRTPTGTKVIACPAQTRSNVTCLSCQLCARRDRLVIIGFYPHGTGSAAANFVAAST